MQFKLVGTLLFTATSLACPISWANGSGRAESPIQESRFRENLFSIGTGRTGRGSVSIGARFQNVGVQVGLFNNIELDRNAISNGLPPANVLPLGNYVTTPGYGLDFMFYFGESMQGGYVGLGLYNESRTRVFRSPVTGELFDFGSTESFRGAYSIGYFGSVSSDSKLGLGYHTMLGWNLSFSFFSR